MHQISEHIWINSLEFDKKNCRHINQTSSLFQICRTSIRIEWAHHNRCFSKKNLKIRLSLWTSNWNWYKRKTFEALKKLISFVVVPINSRIQCYFPLEFSSEQWRMYQHPQWINWQMSPTSILHVKQIVTMNNNISIP